MKKGLFLIGMICFFSSLVGGGDEHVRETSLPFAPRRRISYKPGERIERQCAFVRSLPKVPVEKTLHGSRGTIATIKDAPKDRFIFPGVVAEMHPDLYTEGAISLLAEQIAPVDFRVISRVWVAQAHKDMSETKKSSAETDKDYHSLSAGQFEEESPTDFDALLKRAKHFSGASSQTE